MNILNLSSSQALGETKTPGDLAMSLQKCMLRLKGDHMTSDGRGVDYASLAASEAFKEYCKLSQELVQCDCTSLMESERKAFFINVYNCLTIHGLAGQVPGSVLEVAQFWSNTAYSIGGHTYSLDDIEHGILRGNRCHPSRDTPPFDESDPRKQLAMSSCDPRIHFALVCGAKSCPPIQVYSASNLDRALTMAAKNFCSQEVSVDVSTRSVQLSKIFLWYGGDFASNERDLLRKLLQFVSEDTRAGLEELLANEDEIVLHYAEYNWQLNKL